MINPGFSEPQRQSPLGIAILFLSVLGNLLRNFGVVLVIIFFRENTGYKQLMLSGILLLALLFAIGIAYLRYRKFTFFINNETNEFILTKGIINTSQTNIEKRKIQEVIISQPFLHKVLGIYQVEIDSPGTDKKDLKIEAVSYETAQQLREMLVVAKADPEFVSDSFDAAETISKPVSEFKISPLSLMKWGFTSDYIYSIFALIGIVFYLFDKLNDFFMDQIETAFDEEMWQEYLLFSNVLIVAAVILFFCTAVFINALRKIITYWDTRVQWENKRVRVSYGLFNSREAVINPDKVQQFISTQNILQKKINIGGLKITQIGEDEFDQNTSTIIPACNNEEREKLQSFFFGTEVTFQETVRMVKFRLVSRLLVWAVAGSGIVGFVLYFFEIPVYFLLFYTIFVSILVALKFINSRLYFGEKFMKERSGIWDVDEKVSRIQDTQMIEVSQYFWQRKRGIGSVNVYTAGGSISQGSSKMKTLKKWVNYIVYQTEIKNWNT